jgi:aryl-alcohol dehydrogenase-like predicted oxidoreductase
MSSNEVVSVDDLLKESKAEYRQLGKSGLRVSVPILGAMSFGDKKWLPWVLDEDEALPLLKAAYDKGINTWDTGAYSLG